MMALLSVNIAVSWDGALSQHAQYQQPETEAAQYNSYIIHFII